MVEKEIVVNDYVKLNLLSVALLIIIFIFTALLSYLINGDIKSSLGINLLHYSKLWFCSIVCFAGTVIHELMHGIVFIIQGVPRDKIKFGFKWKYLMPYAQCLSIIKVSVLRLDYLAPFVFPGLVFLFSGIILKFSAITYAGIFLCAGSMGDLWGIWLTRSLKPDTLILDHPEKVGFQVIKS